MREFDLGQMEMSGAAGLDALFEREPHMVTPSKTAKVRVASCQQLKNFTRLSAETLIHKSDRDLWAIKSEGGQFFIERLFDDHGTPLKG
jgi:hypothetical protein